MQMFDITILQRAKEKIIAALVKKTLPNMFIFNYQTMS